MDWAPTGLTREVKPSHIRLTLGHSRRADAVHGTDVTGGARRGIMCGSLYPIMDLDIPDDAPLSSSV